MNIKLYIGKNTVLSALKQNFSHSFNMQTDIKYQLEINHCNSPFAA